MQDRVLILAPRGRDGPVIQHLLERHDRGAVICPTLFALVAALAEGAGAAIVTEEALVDVDLRPLNAWLAAQSPWSDFPFVVLTTQRSGRRPEPAVKVLADLGNVILLERPINGETLTRAVVSALRARARQYQARQQLIDLEASQTALRQLNETLESRISQRTEALARANDQLMKEIAERERVQATLVQAQKMDAVGHLTGGIAHDFNNLLTAIMGNLDLISRRADDERVLRMAANAREACKRAAKLTGQLLAFSRSQRLDLKPVDVNGLIGQMDDLLTRTLGQTIAIHMTLAEGELFAMADANQLELAVLNLAINARDAMPDGGALTVGSRVRPAPPGGKLKPGDYVVLSVRDTGMGVPSAVLDKVFDPFFTTKPLGKGTGLGLSQVYGIAEQSGGAATIESVEGEGALVEIWLPRASADRDAATPAACPPSAADGGRERVLVIEDDPHVRRFIVDCLDGLGYQVFEAASGREGLERMREGRPDVMIVDFAMPGMNGIEVAGEARSWSPKLPIILATGYADMDAVHKVIESDAVLRKPFDVNDLDRVLRRALATAG